MHNLRASVENNRSFGPESSGEEQANMVDNEFEIEVKKVKRNGWIWPLHLYQILTWIFVTIDLIYLVIEIFPMQEHVASFVSLLLIYGIIFVPLGYLDIKLWFSDPTDPVIYEERLKAHNQQQGNNLDGEHVVVKSSKYDVIDTRNYDSKYVYVCDICLTHVKDNTKHCRECNRWVSKFDHHWKWLNNWIGEINYREFIWLISIYLIYNMYFVIAISVHLANIFKYNDESYDVFYTSPIPEDSTIAKAIIWWMMLFYKIVQSLLNLHLLLTHVWLWYTNQTTYDWISNKKKGGKIAQDTHFNDQYEDENMNSHSVMSRREQRNVDLRVHKSKIVHRID